MNLTSSRLIRIWNTLLNTADKVADRDRLLARPIHIHIEVSDFCNLKCPHCPREHPDSIKDTGHIPLEAVEKLVPWLKRASWVGLTGNGEPFLHPQIMEIIDLVRRCGAIPTTISNATLWKRLNVIDRLVGPEPFILNVSIDGGTRETFEKWRLKADFEEVKANLFALRDEKRRRGVPFPVTAFVVCLMKDNINEIEELVALGAEAGVGCIQFQNMLPYSPLVAPEQMLRDINECRRAITRARKAAAPHGIRIDWTPMAFDIEERGDLGGMYGSLNAEQAEQETTDSKQKQTSAGPSYHCDYVWNRVHVTVQGDIKFCCFWKGDAVGNLATHDFGSLWNGPQWTALRADLMNGTKPASCEGCHNLTHRSRKQMLRTSWDELKTLTRG